MGIYSASAAPLPERVDKRKAAQAAILALSNNLDDRDVAALARNIVLKYDSEDISSVFQRSERGGLGIGALGKSSGQVDSIQALITRLSRTQPPPAKLLNDYYGDLMRSAKVVQAMSELAPHRAATVGVKGEQQLREWAKVSADFKEKAEEFRIAVESRDPIKVRNAAQHLNHTCCDCHNLIQ
jgi:hypothetical protein